jgi:hypothetical protein
VSFGDYRFGLKAEPQAFPARIQPPLGLENAGRLHFISAIPLSAVSGSPVADDEMLVA